MEECVEEKQHKNLEQFIQSSTKELLKVVNKEQATKSVIGKRQGRFTKRAPQTDWREANFRESLKTERATEEQNPGLG